jgi:hypothetical protein
MRHDFCVWPEVPRGNPQHLLRAPCCRISFLQGKCKMNILDTAKTMLRKLFLQSAHPDGMAFPQNADSVGQPEQEGVSAKRTPLLQDYIFDFKELRNSNYIYVDKTQYIVKLFNCSRRVFISRPR